MWVARPTFALSTLPVLLPTIVATENTVFGNFIVLMLYILLLCNDINIGGTNFITAVLGFAAYLGGHWIDQNHLSSYKNSHFGTLLGIIAGLSLMPFWPFFAWKVLRSLH